jgi:ribosomal protein S12 methylthiotransferase
VTQLSDDGFEVVGEQDAAEVVVVNTCGFIDAAKAESYAAIEQALNNGREVVVTGCMGAKRDELLSRYPQLQHVSGPGDVAPVVDAVQSFYPARRSAYADRWVGPSPREARLRLTPSHYGYLKISEGCNHKCSFCIIPSMRGQLRSNPLEAVIEEAEAMAAQGAMPDGAVETRLFELCRILSDIAPWVRLHYVYPYPSVDRLVELMADGKILPYLDVPLQHASPRILKAMRRPAAAEKALQRIRSWREICPDLAIRSTFIVGFPGETEEDVGLLLDLLEAAQLDRVGCFTYSHVDGAAANQLGGAVDERDMLDRQEMVYELQANISAQRLDRLVGKRLQVLVDTSGDVSTARTRYDAPEIDGVVYIEDGGRELHPGDMAWVNIVRHDEHDLYGRLQGRTTQIL